MRLAVAVLIVLLAGCASTPVIKVGPCYTTPCGDLCCNNDGRICPTCWEEE